MQTLVVVLTVLGGVLPIAGVGLGARRTLAERNRIRAQRDRLRDAAFRDEAEFGHTGVAHYHHFDDVRRSEGLTTPEDDLSMRSFGWVWQTVQLRILDRLLPDLRLPGLLTAVGIVAGTVGSILSLYV